VTQDLSGASLIAGSLWRQMYISLYCFTTQYTPFHGLVAFMNGEWGNLFLCVFS